MQLAQKDRMGDPLIRAERQTIRLQAGKGEREGVLELPDKAGGIVLFAHGSGNSRLSPRNQYVARALQGGGLGTLLVDLLTPEEERDYETMFDIALLAHRLEEAAEAVKCHSAAQLLPLGVFGVGKGAAAALQFSSWPGSAVAAVVSAGGRPDLAGDHALHTVQAATLLIVAAADEFVAQLNRDALAKLPGEKRLEAVPGATDLSGEPDALERVAHLALGWFRSHLHRQRRGRRHGSGASE